MEEISEIHRWEKFKRGILKKKTLLPVNLLIEIDRKSIKISTKKDSTMAANFRSFPE